MSRYFKNNKIITQFRLQSIIVISVCAILIAPLSFSKEKISSIDNAVQEIRGQTKGKIISADTVTVEGIKKHRIKVLMPNGHVKVFYKPVK